MNRHVNNFLVQNKTISIWLKSCCSRQLGPVCVMLQGVGIVFLQYGLFLVSQAKHILPSVCEGSGTRLG